MVAERSVYYEYPLCPGSGGYACAFTWAYIRPRHHHPDLEFNLVVRGRATLDVGGRVIEVGPGSLLWFLPEQDHKFLGGSSDFDCFVAVFRPELVDRASKARGLFPGRRFPEQLRTLSAEAIEPLRQRCRAASEEALHGTTSDNYGTLLHVAWRAFAEAPRTASRLQHPAVIEAARLLHQEPTLRCGRLSQRAGMSREELSRLFSAQMGLTLVEYRNRVRFARFVAEVDAGERNLAQAALRAGFGSYAQFHRVFRTLTGCSPRTYFTGALRAALNHWTSYEDHRAVPGLP